MKELDPLFPNFAALRAAEIALTDRLYAVRNASASRKAIATGSCVAWTQELKDIHFDRPRELADLMNWVIDGLESGIVHMTHPGHLGLFNPAPTFAAECADRIVAVFNPQICVYSHAPAAVEIELHVIREVARRAGLPNGSSGHFTSGGAEANFTAVLCALQEKCPSYGEHGLAAFTGPPVLYVSKESHMAWLKIAHATGIGRSAVRLINTDGHGRMNSNSLQEAIAADFQQNFVPILIAATAGTTNAGMIDPLKQCSEIARQYGTWFHVDAAWGGALIANDSHRDCLNGIEQADSITIDAHKWFATTMGAGMFLTTKPEIPSQAFRVNASYMPSVEKGKDFYANSNQWSRRFVGLRLFLALGAAGWDGYARHVAHSIRLTNRLARQLQSRGWSLVNSSPMAVACLIPPQGCEAVQNFVQAVLEDGRFWVSEVTFEGRSVLRACVTNARTSETDIDTLVEFLSLVQIR
ncbi:MAG: aminotransferase class V-fold PLP-dependent enzyme [Gammaproteobacteria bacterium]|nr:aminotransferase class V-fold PLP-dependent enzyme [Gammaproteobacteria bacterium]